MSLTYTIRLSLGTAPLSRGCHSMNPQLALQLAREKQSRLHPAPRRGTGVGGLSIRALGLWLLTAGSRARRASGWALVSLGLRLALSERPASSPPPSPGPHEPAASDVSRSQAA